MLNSRYGYFLPSVKDPFLHDRSSKLDLVESDELGRTLILDGITQVAEKSSSNTTTHGAPRPVRAPRSAPRPGHRRGDGGIPGGAKYPESKRLTSPNSTTAS